MSDLGLDLFGATEETAKSEGLRKLDVVKMDYVGAETLTWEELFDGFDDLKAITFSSGIGFVEKLLRRFKTAEIIFGCEEVMSGTMQDAMAFQTLLLERIRKDASKTLQSIVDRIEEKSLHFYVSRNRLSHEKVYLLSAEDGRKRVVMGSANMSFNAFSGHQRENICYIDGERAYDWYLDSFEDLKRESVDEISQKALITADAIKNIDALPIVETVKVKKALIIEPVQDVKEDVRFILDVHQLSSKLKPSMPPALMQDKRTGRIRVDYDAITKVRRLVAQESENERIAREDYPQLDVDVDNSIVRKMVKSLI